MFGAGHGPVGVGPGRHQRLGLAAGRPERQPRSEHAAGDGQPVRGHGGPADDADVRPRAGDGDRPTRRRRPRRSLAGGRRESPGRQPGDDHRAPRATAAAAWSPASRSRPTAATRGIPATIDERRRADGQLDLRVGRARAARRRRSSRARSMTAATSRRRPTASRSTSRARARSGAHDAGDGGPGDPNSVNDSGDPRRDGRVKFTVGHVRPGHGIRFYKAVANTGTHVGSLWTASGQLLASATFTGETASGWQTGQVLHAGRRPSEHDICRRRTSRRTGHYAVTPDYFYHNPAPTPIGWRERLNSPPLQSLEHHELLTGSTPTDQHRPSPPPRDNGENYWVDVSFRRRRHRVRSPA